MIEGFAVWVVLTLGGTSPVWDIGGHVTLDVPTAHSIGACGTSWLPHISTVDTTDHRWCPPLEEVLRHEEAHQRHHWGAMGMAFPVAYALTLARPFEDYHDGMEIGLPERACPLIRVNERIRPFPCWRF